jgi:hypothetical protein
MTSYLFLLFLLVYIIIRGVHCNNFTDSYNILYEYKFIPLTPPPPLSNSFWWISLCYLHAYKTSVTHLHVYTHIHTHTHTHTYIHTLILFTHTSVLTLYLYWEPQTLYQPRVTLIYLQVQFRRPHLFSSKKTF